ncbi:MAG: YkgJ family cysteine cluster protein [Myxococcales bacterium]|nr:YkgJ family cysteine cluster protein [Myxococcales bacterium]
MAKSPQKTKIEPFLVRGGAAYRCFGDGLCCTDIHGLGPVTKHEAKELRTLSADPVVDQDGEIMLRVVASGGCGFLQEDLLCKIHAERGIQAKPEGCRRFPFRLTATPDGGRVTAQHRCPCRTMGDRPEFDLAEAKEALRGGNGQSRPDARIDGSIPIDKQKRMKFEKWKTIEAELLARLSRDQNPEAVLDARPFPVLRGTTWKRVATEMLESEDDGTAFAKALRWVGEALMAVHDDRPMDVKVRPWASAFERAAKRPGERSPEEVLSDWLADEIWCLEWSQRLPWNLARRDYASRLAIAGAIRNHLSSLGVPPGQAAAESLTILDAVCESQWWEDVTTDMVP